MIEDKRRTLIYFILAITVLGMVLRLYGISEQPPIDDEIQVAFSAENYMEEGQFGPTMAYHPNLRNILIYVSMKTLGTDAFGLRGFSLLFGILSVPILGVLVYRITSNTVASCIAAFFLAVDPVHITFSRQAIQEVHTAFFFLSGTLLVFTSIRTKRTWVLLPAGLIFGLGAASKAHTLFPLFICFLYVMHAHIKEQRNVGEICFAALSLTVLPFTVYLITYVPWFARGYGLLDWVFMQKSLYQVMATYAGNPIDTLITDVRPWQWFINPFVGYGNFTYFEGKPFITMAMGNPLIWLLVLPSTIYLFYTKEDIEGKRLLLAFFLISYIPLVTATRPIWLISAIAVTPFAYALIGLAAFRVIKNAKVIVAYGFLVLLASLLLFPMTMGRAWDYGYLRPLTERLNPHGQVLENVQERQKKY